MDEFDSERSAIKLSVFRKEKEHVNGLYQKWAEIHCASKEILEVYFSKISHGESSVHLFSNLAKNAELEGEIEGYSKIKLFSRF